MDNAKEIAVALITNILLQTFLKCYAQRVNFTVMEIGPFLKIFMLSVFLSVATFTVKTKGYILFFKLIFFQF